MKIVHVTFGFGLGGIETMLHNIANEQERNGHEIHIVVLNDIVNQELKNSLNPKIHFHCLMRKVGSKNPLFILRLNWLLYQLHPDVIHLHYSSIASYILLQCLKSKLCVTQHDICFAKDAKHLHQCKKIFSISHAVHTDVLNHTGLNSFVVLNGIDIKAIKINDNRNNDKLRIVQVSRLLHEKKGQHILIQAIANLVNKGYHNLSLDLIGDGESMNFLIKMTDKLNIASYVNFLGAKDQSFIFEHLCDYDLYVQPSIYEGFGLTVAESMAAKVPVLVSENQGPLEIIDNGKYGYYFKNQDVEDCASKIEMFLKHKNDTGMINSAYQRVTSLYNVKNTARKYLELYETL